MAEFLQARTGRRSCRFCPPFRLKRGRPSGPPSSQRCWRWSSVCRWVSALSPASRGACVPAPLGHGAAERPGQPAAQCAVLILMIIVIPLSRAIVGTSIGTVASIVPLVIASFRLCRVWSRPVCARWTRVSLRPPRAWVRRRCKLSPKSWCPRACPAWLPT